MNTLSDPAPTTSEHTDPGAAAPSTDKRPGGNDSDKGSGNGAPGEDLFGRVVQGAHATVDRLAETAAPHVHRLEEGVAQASEALQAGADQARAAKDKWAESLRNTVRENPIGSVATALALGWLIARLTR